MGMQCTFSYLDMQDGRAMDSLYDEKSDTWTVRDIETHLEFNLHLYVPEDKQTDKHFCWFDCGSASEDQMKKIKWLIQNRIPFNCA